MNFTKVTYDIVSKQKQADSSFEKITINEESIEELYGTQ
jgi:hypothetical protein